MGGRGIRRKGCTLAVQLSVPGPSDCPFCKTGTIHYDTIRETEDGVAYGFTCKKCGAEADELFAFVFVKYASVQPFTKKNMRSG